MAYFCLTKLEQMAGGRVAAAARFGISKRVLCCIADLSTNMGGDNARRQSATLRPHTPEEQSFLRPAIKTLIHRAAEVDSGPHPAPTKISLAHLR